MIFKRKASSDKRSGNVSFTVPCAIIRKNETLAMTGSGTLFDNWKKFIPLKMSAAPLWDVTLKVEEPFEYKFVILNQNGEEIWESGPNRRLAEAPTEGNFLEIRNVVPKFETRLCASTGSAGGAWRGAGTAIPVFSLRSESSFGVGEFKDLKSWLTGPRPPARASSSSCRSTTPR